MQRFLLTSASLAALAGCLSGCGGNGGGGGVTTTPPVQSARFEDQFGSSPAGFGAIYGSPLNAEPRDISASDVIAVNATAEPVAIPGT